MYDQTYSLAVYIPWSPNKKVEDLYREYESAAASVAAESDTTATYEHYDVNEEDN